MSEKKEDPLSAMEDLRLGLQYLDNEEENLIILKSHLSKIKKIREEQIRKDSIVEVLQDRVATLEKELSTVTRQSADIQEILTERISFLESALKGKDELEFKFCELTRYSETLSESNMKLVADLKSEVDRVNECRQVCDQKDIEITRCRAETSLEKQKVSQLQILFETFKSELIHKEDLLSAQHRGHTSHDNQLNQALNIANATIEDLSHQLNKSEENVGRLVAELSYSESTVAVCKKDLIHFDKELKLWKEMYAELEAVLLKVKGQLLLTQQSHENELTSLRSEVESSKSTSLRFKQDLNEVQSILNSIAQDVKMIHTLDQQHQATHRNGSGGSGSKLHNAQIMALALSLQKTVSATGSSVLFNTTDTTRNKRGRSSMGESKSGSSTGNSSSLVVGIQADISVIVQNVCDMIYRIFAKEEEESELKTELRQRSETVQSSSAYCMRLEQNIADLQEDLRLNDEAVKLLVDYFTQGRLVLSKNSSSGISGFGGGLDEDAFGGVEYLSSGSPSSVRASSTPIASVELRESIHAINSEARALLLDSLYNSLRSSLHSMLILEQEKTEIIKKFHSTKAQHCQEIEDLAGSHERQVWQLERELTEMRRQCDEALIAVRFADYEAQQEISRIRYECDQDRRTKTTGAGKGGDREVEELRSLVHSYQTKYTQVTLSLEHTLQYTSTLRDQLESLQSVYGLSTSLYQQLAQAQATLVNEIHSLAHSFGDVWEDDSGRLIRHNAAASSSGGHRPESSSRRQRYSKYHPATHTGSPSTSGSPYASRSGGGVSAGFQHHRITLRSLVIFVLAANRFRRFRVEGLKKHNSTVGTGANNLLAVAATSAKLDSPRKYQEQTEAHEIVAFYPAFTLPSLRILTTASSQSVTEQLLHAAECYPASSALMEASFLSGAGGNVSLLDDIKLKRHQFLWWKETAGLSELYNIEKQLSRLNKKLQEDKMHQEQQQQQQRYSASPKSPSSGGVAAAVGRSVESNASLHVLPSKHHSSPSKPQTASSPTSGQDSPIYYRYSGKGGSTGVVVRSQHTHTHSSSSSSYQRNVTSTSTTNGSMEEAQDPSTVMAMLESSAVDFNLSRSTWRGLNDSLLASSNTRISNTSSSSSNGSGSLNDHDVPSGFNEDDEEEDGNESYEDFDADLRALSEAKYTSPYPVFHDTSASQLLNDTTTNEILEIYSDIGKLTGKLKLNSRLSSTT